MGTQNQSKTGENPVPDIHALKASLQELKKRFLISMPLYKLIYNTKAYSMSNF